MNFPRSAMPAAVLALAALSLVSTASIHQDAFAQEVEVGMTLTAMADRGSDTVTVMGKTASDATDVALTVTTPSGDKIVEVRQATPDENGEFMADFKIGSQWTEDGFYEIKAKQGSSSLYNLKVFVEVTDGTAEMTSETESSMNTGIFSPVTSTAAEDAGITLDEIPIVVGAPTFEVTGTTDRVGQDITVTIESPMGNIVTVEQVSPAIDGNYATEIAVGENWKEDGFYTVTVRQFDDSKYTASTQVDIMEGVVVPEFGAIAAMILAVAIIAVIAVSARSKIGIVPRY